MISTDKYIYIKYVLCCNWLLSVQLVYLFSNIFDNKILKTKTSAKILGLQVHYNILQTTKLYPPYY